MTDPENFSEEAIIPEQEKSMFDLLVAASHESMMVSDDIVSTGTTMDTPDKCYLITQDGKIAEVNGNVAIGVLLDHSAEISEVFSSDDGRELSKNISKIDYLPLNIKVLPSGEATEQKVVDYIAQNKKELSSE